MSRSNFLVVLALLLLLMTPVAVAEAQTPPDPLGDATGTVLIFDHLEQSDGAIVSLSDANAPPEGMEFVAWLASDDQSSFLNLGALTVDFWGNVNHVFDSNSANYTGENLIVGYNSWLISVETADSAPDMPSSLGIRSQVFGEATIQHIRNALAAVTALQGQLDTAIQHANLAANAENLEDVHDHAQHVVNVIEGENGPNYSGLHLNPGDGVGILSYAMQRSEAEMAATAAEADAESILATSTRAVVATLERAEAWAGMARDAALMAIAEDDVAVAKLFMGPGGASAASLLTAARDGFDVNGDRMISWNSREGGAAQAYLAVQMMATLSAHVGSLPAVEPPAPPPPPPPPAPLQPTAPGLPGVGDALVAVAAQLTLVGSIVLLLAGGVTLAVARRRNRF